MSGLLAAHVALWLTSKEVILSAHLARRINDLLAVCGVMRGLAGCVTDFFFCLCGYLTV